MLIKTPPSWQLKDHHVTDESLFRNRRSLLKGMGVGAIAAALPFPALAKINKEGWRAVTDEELATTYNNFYEFGSHKRIASLAQKLTIDPWNVVIDGLVEEEQNLSMEDILKRMPIEERIYRHRCVEAWSMTVPYNGFMLRDLLALARPLGSAKYVKFETFQNSSEAPGQRQFWYPWPYVEGITIEEAAHDLTFMATGLYGKPIPKQNGAPLRIALPWKYGFKHIKSIVRITLTDRRPVSFWEEIQKSEYGFWANVNPEVDHPRWSQATEKPLGQEEREPTLLYNGYAEEVAGLYTNLQNEVLFR